MIVDKNVFELQEFTALNSSMDTYINTIRNNSIEITKAALTSSLALSTNGVYNQKLANQNFISRFWGDITGKNKKLKSEIAKNDEKIFNSHFLMIQKFQEENLLSYELVVTMNNKFNVLYEDLHTEISGLGNEISGIYDNLNDFFKMAKLKFEKVENRINKLERDTGFLKWSRGIQYVRFDNTDYLELKKAEKVVCVVSDFYNLTNGIWDFGDLLILKQTLFDLGVDPSEKILLDDICVACINKRELVEKILSPIADSLKETVAPVFISMVSAIKKIQYYTEEGKEIIDEIVAETGNAETAITEKLVSKYMKKDLFVDSSSELSIFDFSIELLFNYQVLNEQFKLSNSMDEKAIEEERKTLVSVFNDEDGGNHKKAFERLNQLADQTLNPDVQISLGVCYSNGSGVPKDECEAVKWYRKAAEQENAVAQRRLGVCYSNGRGVPKDEREAVKWYQKSAEQGNADAQIDLGVCYANGSGVPKDECEAVKWCRRSAEQGNADAQWHLGICCEYGKGVPKDKREAVKWYRRSAEQENADAQRLLGDCYRYGKGVPKDEREAAKWYQKAEGQGKC